MSDKSEVTQTVIDVGDFVETLLARQSEFEAALVQRQQTFEEGVMAAMRDINAMFAKQTATMNDQIQAILAAAFSRKAAGGPVN